MRRTTPSASSRASTTSSGRASSPGTPACCSRTAARASRSIPPIPIASRHASARRRWPACGLRPPRRWRGERLVTMSAWRWGVYKVSYYIGRGLIRTARLLAYATAGVLTRKELGRAAAGRWSDFGIDETYVLSGLFTWEENFYFRFLKPDDHVLIVGAGSGRDLIGLRRAGYRVDGLEPSATAVTLARTMCAKAGVEADFHVGWIETTSITEKYDVFIFSWYCYSYIPDRATRIGALRAASRHLAPGGRIILSYTVTEPVTRYLPRAVAARGLRPGGAALRRTPCRTRPGRRPR